MPSKLTILIDKWDKSRGGREIYLADLMRYVKNAGHPVQVLCQRSAEPDYTVTVQQVPHIRFPAFLREGHFSRNIHELIQKDKDYPVLTVQPHDAATHYQLHAGLYSTAFEAERESMDSTLRRWLYRPANRLNFKRQWLLNSQQKLLTGKSTPKLMTFSRGLGRELQQIYGISSESIFTLPLGVDLDHFQPATHPVTAEWERWESTKRREELRILFVAHNFALKGLNYIFRVLSQKKHFNLKARLLVVGNGPVTAYKKLARKYGITSQVLFLGGIEQRHLIQLYQSSDALVHPTFYDPCSLVTLEALACGCPVVTTRKCGASELFESGREGFILDDPRNTEALGEALRSLQDPQRLRKMSWAACQLVKKIDAKIHMRGMMKWLGLISCSVAGATESYGPSTNGLF